MFVAICSRQSSTGRAEYPIDFEVTVPASIPLHVRDTSGIIRISQVNAPVDVHDGSGTLTISDVHGAVTVTFQNFSMTVPTLQEFIEKVLRPGAERLKQKDISPPKRSGSMGDK